LAAKEGPNRPHMVQSGGIVQQNRARTGRLTDYDDSEATSIIAGQNSIRL